MQFVWPKCLLSFGGSVVKPRKIFFSKIFFARFCYILGFTTAHTRFYQMPSFGSIIGGGRNQAVPGALAAEVAHGASTPPLTTYS